MITENNPQTNCMSCHGKIVFDSHTDERICNKCGIVIPMEDEFLHSNTCMSSKEHTQTSVESLTTNMMYEMFLPTTIGKKDIDANGKQIRNSDIYKIRRMHKFTLSNDNKTRNMNKAIWEIRRITEILGLKSVVAERATYIYTKAFSGGMIKGRSISGIAAASIYVACKEMEIPHSMSDIESLVEGINKKNIMRYHKMLLKFMRINLNLPSPFTHISRIADRAGLSGKTERRAIEILSKVYSDSLLAGKKPVSIAAAAVYIASQQMGEHTTQLRIAIATDLTTITIRKRCIDINKILASPNVDSEIESDGKEQNCPKSMEMQIAH